jgi:hypothetical protein
MAAHTLRRLAGMALVFAGLCAPGVASAQSLNLRDLLTDFLRRGIILAPPAVGTDHSAHFVGSESSQFNALEQVSGEIAYQLSTFPLSSSAGGFAYQFDPALGVFNRQTRSFGPIFTERAFNIGKGKVNLGVNYSRFTFDKLDDLDLRSGDMQLIFSHQDPDEDGNFSPFFEGDLVSARVFLNVETSITALVATYGVSDRFDFGMAVPLVEVDLAASAEAEVERLATGQSLPDTHVFPNGTSTQTFRQSGTASGIGDVVLRAKYRLTGGESALFAILGEARLPTGDETNLLGTGAIAGTMSLVGTLNQNYIAPHFNVGYTVTGEDLPDEIEYSAGFDWIIDPKITVAADVLGRHQNDIRSVAIDDTTFTANMNPSGEPDLVSGTFSRLTYTPGESRNVLYGSVGVKVNFAGNFLLSLNGLFPLTDKGLRDEFTPLIGVDYSF